MKPLADERKHKGTNHRGGLIQEILDGRLSLRTDQAYRNIFGFCIDKRPVGIFGIWSLEGQSKALRLLRAWNYRETTIDPFTGLTVPCAGPQFEHVQPGVPLFLIEFGPNTGLGSPPVDRVAFSAERFEVNDANVPGMPPYLRFEVLDIHELKIFD